LRAPKKKIIIFFYKAMKFNYVLICSDKTPHKATKKMTKSRTQSDVATTTRCQKTKWTKRPRQTKACSDEERERERERETKFSKFPTFPKFFRPRERSLAFHLFCSNSLVPQVPYDSPLHYEFQATSETKFATRKTQSPLRSPGYENAI
jgi:hypothetical protein